MGLGTRVCFGLAIIGIGLWSGPVNATVEEGEAAASPPSIETFLKDPVAGKPSLSPSGRYLFVTRIKEEPAKEKRRRRRKKKGDPDMERVEDIIIADMEQKEKPIAMGMGPRGRVLWSEWISDDRFLVGVVAWNRKSLVPATRVLSFDRRTMKPVVLFGEERRLLRNNYLLSAVTSTLPDDPDHIIMPAIGKLGDLDLFKVNVLDGEVEVIGEGTNRTFKWFTDRKGKPIIRLDRNARRTRLFVYTWSDEEERWKRVKTINMRKDSDTLDFDPIANGPEEGQLFVRAHPEDEERATIKLYDYRENVFVKTVLEHPEVDIRGGFVDAKTGAFAGAWFIKDRYGVILENKTLQRHFDALDSYFRKEANVRFVDFSDNGSRLLIYVYGPRLSGEYHLYDFAERRAELLFQENPDLPYNNLGPVSVLTIPARDGTPLRAYLTHPPGQETGPAPLVVMPHGGPESFDYYTHESEVQFLATRGYRVLQVNFRGSSNQGRSWARAGYGEWGGLMQDDVTDAVRHIFDQGLATPERTCIVGASYGGYVALYGAMATPELYRCAVSRAGVSDLLKSLASDRREYGSDSGVYEYWLKSIGDPKEDRERLEQRSPARHADKITIPVLLVHGTKDVIVPLEQSKLMHKALKKASKPVDYLEIEDARHSGWNREDTTTYWKRLEAFLAEHIGGAAP